MTTRRPIALVRRIRHMVVAPLIALIIATGLLVPSRAMAQGTPGTLPDPISTRQLMRYADRLALSPEQRLALEVAHDEYKARFRVLREGDIQEFLDEMNDLQSEGMPQRGQVEKFIDHMHKLLGKIASLDNRLFDRMIPMLSETQVMRLPRVRLARERDRFKSQEMMPMMGRTTVDLSEIFMRLEAPDADLEAADSIIATYERQLTEHVRKQAQSSGTMMLTVMDAVAEAGYSDISEEEMQDPKVMQAMMEAMQEAFASITKKSQEAMVEVNKLNAATYRSAAAVMPERIARDFRNDYYRAAFGELSHIITMADDHMWDRAQEIEGLTEEQREGMHDLGAGYQQRLDAIIIEGIALVEKYRADFSPFDFDQDVMAQYQKGLTEVNEKAGEILAETMVAVAELVGQERLNELQAVAPTQPGVLLQTESLAIEMIEDGGNDDGADHFSWYDVPARPINRLDVSGYAKRLELDEDRRAIISDMHADYRQQFRELAVLGELREARTSYWTYDRETGRSTAPTEDAIEGLDRLRRQAFDEIEKLDDLFFSDLRVAVAAAEQGTIVDRLRRSRLRAMLRNDHNMSWGYYGGQQTNESGVDLESLVSKLEIATEVNDAIDGTIAAYETASVDLLREQFLAQLDARVAQDKLSAHYQRIQNDDDDDESLAIEAGMEYQRIMAPSNERIAKANKAVIELNRSTLDNIIEHLPDDATRELHRAYQREAFPEVFNDPTAVEDHIVSALALDDLTQPQRDQLSELAATYRPAYEHHSQELVEITASRVAIGFGWNQNTDWQEYQRQESRLAKLRFERNELNDRAIGRMKALLREEQLVAIGGLPEPPEEQRFPF